MRIVITGTPGSGKSTIAKRLSKKLGAPVIDIKKVVQAKKILGKNKEVSIPKLRSALSFLKNKKNFIVEGHLACEVKIPSDFVFVLRCNPKTLQKRLSKRKYSKKKLAENLLAEMLDYCTQRVSVVYGRKPIEIDSSKRSLSGCMLVIEHAIRHKKKSVDNVDYSQMLEKYLKTGRLK